MKSIVEKQERERNDPSPLRINLTNIEDINEFERRALESIDRGDAKFFYALAAVILLTALAVFSGIYCAMNW